MAIRKMDKRTNDGDKTLYTIEQHEPHSKSWKTDKNVRE